MTQMHFLTDWTDAAIGIAFWVCLLWPAIIRLFWPWYRDEWGWNMVLKTEMIAVALLAPILHLEFGIRPGIGLIWTEVIAVTLIPFVLVWRTWIIYRAQQAGAAERATERAAVKQAARKLRERDKPGGG